MRGWDGKTMLDLDAVRAEFDRRFTLAEPGEKAPATPYVVLLLGDDKYVARASDVVRVVSSVPLTRIPSGRAEVLGLGSVHGELLTILSLRALLGRDREYADRAACVLVLQLPGGRVGVACDGTLGLRWVEDAAVLEDGVRLDEGEAGFFKVEI